MSDSKTDALLARIDALDREAQSITEAIGLRVVKDEEFVFVYDQRMKSIGLTQIQLGVLALRRAVEGK